MKSCEWLLSSLHEVLHWPLLKTYVRLHEVNARGVGVHFSGEVDGRLFRCNGGLPQLLSRVPKAEDRCGVELLLTREKPLRGGRPVARAGF